MIVVRQRSGIHPRRAGNLFCTPHLYSVSLFIFIVGVNYSSKIIEQRFNWLHWCENHGFHLLETPFPSHDLMASYHGPKSCIHLCAGATEGGPVIVDGRCLRQFVFRSHRYIDFFIPVPISRLSNSIRYLLGCHVDMAGQLSHHNFLQRHHQPPPERQWDVGRCICC